jgi:hypothetical protein
VKPVRLAWWMFVVGVVGIFSAVLLLAGCGSQQFSGWCLVPQSGQTDSGVTALRVVCQADK